MVRKSNEIENYNDEIIILEILFPKRDLIFRRIFGVEKNKKLLKSFIQAVLNLEKDDISDLTIKDPHLLPNHIDEKYCILDLLVTTNTGTYIHVEVQIANRADMKDRITFYNSRLIADQLSANAAYFLNRAISIIIVDYDLFPEEKDYFSRFRMLNVKNHREFNEKIEYNVLELIKLPKEPDSTKNGGNSLKGLYIYREFQYMFPFSHWKFISYADKLLVYT